MLKVLELERGLFLSVRKTEMNFLKLWYATLYTAASEVDIVQPPVFSIGNLLPSRDTKKILVKIW